MSTSKWTVNFEVFRKKENEPAHFDKFKLEVDPEEYVLDGIERIWAFWDRTLCYRHACHHSTCGACGMRVNNVEKLTCITLMKDVTRDGGTIKVEPLRNFPVISDLAVDMGMMFRGLEEMRARSVLPVPEAAIERPQKTYPPEAGEYIRLADCIECGLCISACPISGTSSDYYGPAVLAGAQQNGVLRNPELLNLVDNENGVWRCHSAFECTAVCPSFVDPARRIMDLRKQVLQARVRQLFNRSASTQWKVEEVNR